MIKVIKKILKHPVFWALLFIIGIHIFNIFQYDFMMEKDSYGWLIKYEDQISSGSMQVIRPFFSALTLILYHITGLETFILFKFVYPFFSVFAILPLWLLTREIKNKRLQFLMFSPLVFSSTIILQFEATRPQIMAMMSFYFSSCFLVLAYLKKDDLLFFIAGAISILGIFFHDVVFFLAIFWVVIFLWKFRRYFFKKWDLVLVFLIFFYPWIEIFQIKRLFKKTIVETLKIGDIILNNFQTNLLFPSKYINVDGIEVGWGGILGIFKYYAFYAGPLFLFLSLIILLFLLNKKEFRNLFLDVIKNLYILPVALSFLFFLMIAEIFPRFLNLAYLPDRAWIFLGILFIVPLFFFLKFLDENYDSKSKMVNLILFLFVIAVTISVVGSIHVNNSFRYIVMSDEMESFEWIKDNLEKNRTIFTCRYGGYLQYHSESNVFRLDNCGKMNISKLNFQIKGEKKLSLKSDIAKKLGNRLDAIEEKETFLKMVENRVKRRRTIGDDIINGLEGYKNSLDKLILIINQESTEGVTEGNRDFPSYIYFSDENLKNPYRIRPYDSGYSSVGAKRIVTVVNKSKDYEKIYSKGSVEIWKYVGE